MRVSSALLLLSLFVSACGLGGDEVDCISHPLRCLDAGTANPGQGAFGKACTRNADCASALRLACIDGACGFTSDLVGGDPCRATLECGEGLYCSAERTCAPAGSANEGGRCESDAACARNLVCSFDAGPIRHCTPAGEGDVGAACLVSADCLAGLACEAGERRCSTARADDFVDFTGLACASDTTAPVAYFEVPRAGVAASDFFRLPFPNDVRRTDAGLSLTGFPSPGDLLGNGVDFVGNYVRAAESGLSGFSTNPVVYFRFSEAYRGAGRESILFYDIDPDSPEYGRAFSRSWGTSVGEVTNYVCPHWLNVRTAPGEPLRAGTTYAIMLTEGITPHEGEFTPSGDFTIMLATSEPSEPSLAAAWRAYAPLRAFLARADAPIATRSLINAAVFTTVDPLAVVRATREAVHADVIPSLIDVTTCAEGITSPCDDGATRVCAVGNDFVELHGRISLPVFQTGAAPYLRTGGGFAFQADRPVVQRHEDVCFGLRVPAGEMPPDGFPLVIHGHATGESFATGLTDYGPSVNAAGGAVLSFDLPAHGTRKNGSALDEAELFENPQNPEAARDNVTQGAADLFSLVRFARNLASRSDTPFGRPLFFDPARFVYIGHDQGARHGALAMALEPDVSAVVLSGLGGDTSAGLVTRRAPIDYASSLQHVLGDRTAAPEGALCPPLLDAKGEPRTNDAGEVLRHTCVGENHPVYGLLQAYFDRVDPVNFAAALADAPKHLFVGYGLNDSYSPETTQKAYVRAAGLTLVAPALVDFAEPAPAPLSGNVTIMGAPYTQGLRQYAPTEGEDGHFVHRSGARADIERFVRARVRGELPPIGD